MELVVYAPVWGQSGLEQLSRNLLIELDKLGVNIELRDSNEWNSERVPLPQRVLSRLIRMTKTKVSALAPHVIYQLPRGQILAPGAPTICYTLFETDRCPSPWIEALSQMDKIFVFSKFNLDSWTKSGISSSKISALPPAVDSFIFNPDGPKLSIKNKKGFTFLCSGDFTERKNFESVIESYVKEFSGREPVTLIFKCHYGGFIKKYRRDCMDRLRTIIHNFNIDNPPRILFYGDKISEMGMAALYRSVDCFVLTSRGEGLGMQYLEAMASGIPIIASDWGAQADYLNGFNSYPVRSYLKVIDDPNYIVKCPQALNGKWCQVEIKDLQDAMRSVVDNYSLAKEKAQKALLSVREMTWQNMAISFIQNTINMYSEDSKKSVLQEAFV